MTYQRRAYDDAATTDQMVSDCHAVEEALALPRRRTAAERASEAVVRPAPSLRYDDFPREVHKPTVDVTDAASRLAAALWAD
jgi:hypothetical protein